MTDLAPVPIELLAMLTSTGTTPALNGEKHAPSSMPIPQGQRNDELYRLGRSLVAKGLTAAAVGAALQAENAARCQPPLPAAEVLAIANHAATQPNRPEFLAGAGPAANGTVTDAPRPPRPRLPLAEAFERFGALERTGKVQWRGTCRLCGAALTLAVRGFVDRRALAVACAAPASSCTPSAILARADLTLDDLVTGDRDDELEAILHPRVAEVPLLAVPAATVVNEPAPDEVVQALAWAGCITVAVSESGAGKTFLVSSIGGAVADGVSWFGRRVRQGSVAYLSFEGDAHGLRLRALIEHGGRTLEHFYLVRATAPLSPRIDFDRVEHPSPGERAVVAMLTALRDQLAADNAPPIRLMVVDTVRCAMTGSEDNSEAVAAFLRAVRRIMAYVPEAAVVLVHHAGWQDGDSSRQRERGSSAWRGNVDATVYVERGEDLPRGARLMLRTLKVRDTEKAPPLHLVRTAVDLSVPGPDGMPATSCVIECDPRSRDEREAEALAAATAETLAVDLRVLRAIAGRPDLATSIKQVRALVGLGSPVVSDAITRLIGREWLAPGKRGEAYRVTDRGQAALTETPAQAAQS